LIYEQQSQYNLYIKLANMKSYLHESMAVEAAGGKAVDYLAYVVAHLEEN
jgi:hypothetical protein